jgi:hypothetical protein
MRFLVKLIIFIIFINGCVNNSNNKSISDELDTNDGECSMNCVTFINSVFKVNK